MPRNRNNSRRQRPRRSRRRRSTVMRSKSLQLICPQSVVVNLEYTDFANRTGSSFYTYTYALNGLFDPNVTGTGAQPVGFDQWSAFYARYEVISCRAKAEFFQNDTGINSTYTMYPSNDATAVAINAAPGQTGAVIGWTSGTSGVSRALLKANYNIRRIVGRQLFSINYTGAAGSNPSNLLYMQLVYGAADGSTVMTVTQRVYLVYRVKFYQRIALGTS